MSTDREAKKLKFAHAISEGHEETAAWVLRNWPTGFMPCCECRHLWRDNDLNQDDQCPRCAGTLKKYDGPLS